MNNRTDLKSTRPSHLVEPRRGRLSSGRTRPDAKSIIELRDTHKGTSSGSIDKELICGQKLAARRIVLLNLPKFSFRWPMVSQISQILFIVSLLTASIPASRQQRIHLPPTRQLSGGFASSRHIYPRTVSHPYQPPINSSASDRRSPTSRQQQEQSPSQLFDIRAKLLELRRQFELVLADSSRQGREVVLGSPCSASSDCSGHIAGSHCGTDRFTCSCLPQHVEFNRTSCLPPKLLGFECQMDAQCKQRVPESQCVSGVCSCPANLVAHRRDKCLSASSINDYCLSDRQCRLNDAHSFCKWRIPGVYGQCKCPPNYKRIPSEATKSPGSIGVKCAPRLGDACLSDAECQLATSDSSCIAETPQDSAKAKWRTSEASALRCHCADGFGESPDRLSCLRVEADSRTRPATGPISEHQLTLSAVNSMDSKHHYELVIPANQSGDLSKGSESAGAAGLSGPTATIAQVPTATPTMATTMSGSDGAINGPPAANRSTTMGSGEAVKMPSSSLGKSCKSRLECQSRDPHSDCINGLCECLRPTPSCSANSTGCHGDTFQCRDGQCISWYFVCDQFKNCADGSDEDECQPEACPPEAFQCRSDGACLARGKLCDGRRDCADGSDESQCSGAADGCHPRAFTCDNGQCLPGYAFCNAVEDCSDGSDESEQTCERVWTLRRRQPVTLEAQQEALNSSKSSRFEPPAGEAEPADSPLVKTTRWSIDKLLAGLSLGPRTPESRGKPAQQEVRRRARGARLLHQRAARLDLSGECPRSAFTCRNGKCRSTAILCSGVDGCGDNSDEDRCQVCRCAPP